LEALGGHESNVASRDIRRSEDETLDFAAVSGL